MKPLPFLEMVLSRLPSSPISPSTLLVLVRVANADGIKREKLHNSASCGGRSVTHGLVARCPDGLYRLTPKGTGILAGLCKSPTPNAPRTR